MSMSMSQPISMSVSTPTPIQMSTTPSIFSMPMPIPHSINHDDSSVRIVAKIIHDSLFSKKKDIQSYAIETYYDANAVFENPILLVESHDQIINQFILLSTFFYIKSEIQSITDSEIAGNHHLVCIDALIKYRLPLRFPPFPCLRLIFGKNNKCCNNEFTLRIISRFEFNEQQKIVRHEDIWSLKDLVESLPIVGFLYVGIARKLTGIATGCAVIVVKELVHAWEEWNF